MAGRKKQAKQEAPNWGGKRENQTGRPTKAEKDKASVQIAFRIKPTEAERFKAFLTGKETLHSVIKRLALEQLEILENK